MEVMDLKEAVQVIGSGWVQKPKGFRVRFERCLGDQWVSDTFPSEKEPLLTSDVMAWELARRFAEASEKAGSSAGGEFFSITVVDQDGAPVKFYGTNALRVLHPRGQAE